MKNEITGELRNDNSPLVTALGQRPDAAEKKAEDTPAVGRAVDD